jgi:hypothetical protein
MRINLKVPYDEKEKAKSLGARWDMEKRIWYVIDPQNLKPFKQWIPELEKWKCTEIKTY